MKRVAISAGLILASAVALAIAAVPAPPAPPAGPAAAAPVTSTVGDQPRAMADVPVRRVVLFSSGVGFFQHSGKVTGNAATELRFKTDQINDILKTLVVSDATANGSVKSITYGSQNPIARTLRSFQIDISSNPTLAGILNQIRGTKISVTLGEEKVEGTVLGVEEKDRPIGPAGKPEEQKVVKVAFVNLITATGIRAVNLEDVKRLEIQDADLQKELDQALTALAQARDKDKKPVIVNFDGEGERQVTVAYLVETPVWKTSYRLILPDPASPDNATMLGWAIVENQTDNDWNNVTLDLIGGRPISFIEDLYQPLYIPRPRVAPKSYASLVPQTYEDGIDTSGGALQPAQPGGVRGGAAGAGGGAAGGGRGGRGGGGGAGGAGGGFGGAGGAGGFGGAPTAGAPAPGMPSANEDANAPVDYAQGVRSIADASKVGEMFQYSVKGVTLPRQRSSMIPIITSSVPFDRVSIYNKSVLAKNPLLGVRLKNKTGGYLLAGPMAVMDKIKRADGSIADSYAGDASIEDVPAGQERLMSYAIDQNLLIDASKREAHTRLVTGSIVKGMLHLRYTDSVDQQYLLDNKSDLAKKVLIEDPIQQGYELKSPEKATEKTDKVYRFEISAPASKAVVFDVVEERVRGEQYAILPMDLGTLDFYTRSGEIPDKVKAVLLSAADKRRALTDQERKLAQKQADRSQILQDEANIRANIQVLTAGSNSRDAAVADLTAKDNELKQVTKDIQDMQKAVDKARNDLEAYLSDTNIN